MNNHRKAYAHLKRAQDILEYGQVQHFGMEAGSSSKRPLDEAAASKSKSSRVDYQPSRHLVLHARCDVSLGKVNPKTGLMERKSREDHERDFTLTAPFVIAIDSDNTIRIRTNSKNEGTCELSIDDKGTIKIRIEAKKAKISDYTVDTPDAMRQIVLLTAETVKLQLTQLQELQESDEFKFLQMVLDRWPEDLGQVQFLETVFDRLGEVHPDKKVRQLQTKTRICIEALLRLHELMNKKD